MPSKKKPRPLFELPAETDSVEPAGWVYRSDAGQEEAPELAEPANSDALTVAFALMTQALALSATIALMPVVMGIRALESMRDR